MGMGNVMHEEASKGKRAAKSEKQARERMERSRRTCVCACVLKIYEDFRRRRLRLSRSSPLQLSVSSFNLPLLQKPLTHSSLACSANCKNTGTSVAREWKRVCVSERGNSDCSV